MEAAREQSGKTFAGIESVTRTTIISGKIVRENWQQNQTKIQ